uniref:RNA1 polyprotein n=1 Tax=Camphor tree fabavirus TaxID=3115796 RepID=A0AAT9JB55_9SECO
MAFCYVRSYLKSHPERFIAFPDDLLEDMLTLGKIGYCNEADVPHDSFSENVLSDLFIIRFLREFVCVEHACLFRNAWAPTLLYKDAPLYYETPASDAVVLNSTLSHNSVGCGLKEFISADESVSEAQLKPPPDKIGSRFWRFAYSMINTMLGVRDSCCVAIWEFAKKAFEVALGPYYENVMGAASWVRSIWDRLKDWCNTVVTETAKWMSGFQECMTLAVGVIGVAAVLILLDKFLVQLGLTQHCLNLGSGFVLIVLGYLGIKEGGAKFGTHAGQLLAGLVSSCQNIVSSIAKSFSADGTEGAGQLNPIDLLDVFAAGVSGISAASIVSTGRVFGAVTQIQRGCSTIWSSVAKICDFLWDLLDKGFGIKSKALNDISVLVGCDVQTWLKKCDAACEYMNWQPSLSQEILFRFRVLKAQGQEIQGQLLGLGTKGSSMVLSTISRALERLQDLLNASALAGVGGPRREPFWVAFYGDSGIGKSTVVDLLASKYLAHKNIDTRDVFTRNASDPFWSTYRRQAVVTFDDLGALTDGVKVREEAELIKLVSRNALPLVMPRLEEKGMFFDSSLILSSSNFKSYNPHANIHEPEAYWRRRSMLVEIVWKDGHDRIKRQDDIVGHQSYILRQNNGDFQIIKRYETFDELYADFLTRVDEHEAKEDALMAQLNLPHRSLNDQIKGVGKLVELIHIHVPDTVEKFLSREHPGWFYLTTLDKRIILWDANYNIKFVPLESVSDADAEWLENDALRISVAFCNALKSNASINPLAANYMSCLADGGLILQDLSIDKNWEAKDRDLYSVAMDLPLWQRALIRGMSKYVSHNGKNFFSALYDEMCDNVKLSHVTDVRSWPMCVKLGVGMMVFFVFGKFIFKYLGTLANFGNASSMSLAAMSVFSKGQSPDGMAKEAREYEYKVRNANIRARHFRNQAIDTGYYEARGQNTGADFVFLMQHCLAYIQCGNLDGQVVMLPGRRLVGVIHFLRRIPDKAMCKISAEGQVYYIIWKASDFKWLADSELGVYCNPTIREIPASVSKRIHYGIEKLPDTFPAKFCSCKLDEVSGEFIPEMAEITVEKRKKALEVYAGEYQRYLPICLEYHVATINKDCGSLVVANIGGIDKVVGIHVAGTNGKGQACFLPFDLEKANGQNFEDDDVKSFPEPNIHGNGLSKIGLIKPEKRFYMPSKTSYVETPTEWHLDLPCDKEPSILVKGDPRLIGTPNADFDPYENGMLKYAESCGSFDEVILNITCDEIVAEWEDHGAHYSFDECSFTEAIGGIEGLEYFDPLVMCTSEGYPYVLERQPGEKGKFRYFERYHNEYHPVGLLKTRLEALDEECNERVPELVALECAKDEKLPIKKVRETPKTRLFSILPLDFNVLVRMKFLRFVRFIMMNRDALPCQVGVNPYGREWGRIANKLLSQGDSILCCDYSRFDGILSKQIMDHIADMINKVCGGSARTQRQRRHLLLACCSRFSISNGKVWRVENGIPSGFPLTVIVNSIFNEIIIRYLYRICFRAQPMIAASFNNYVSMVVYGDDNLISVNPTIAGVFDGNYIKTQAGLLGIKITDGVDKDLPTLSFRTLLCCDFLKRGFKRDNFGRWRAPMEPSTLWSQFFYVKCDVLDMNKAYLENATSVLRELYLVDENRAQILRSRILTIQWIKSSMLPSLDLLRAFHETQMGTEQVNEFLGIQLLQPAMLGPISCEREEMAEFTFKNLCATTAFLYQPQENDFLISLGKVAFKGAHCHVYWDCGYGRGDLPTEEWLERSFVGNNCELYKIIKRAYDCGRRCVFMARLSTVHAVLFLVLFGWKAGILHPMESNLLATRAMEMTKKLGFLKTRFGHIFFDNKSKIDFSTNFPAYGKWTWFDFGDFPIDRHKIKERVNSVGIQFAHLETTRGRSLEEDIELRTEAISKRATHGIFTIIKMSPRGSASIEVPCDAFGQYVPLLQHSEVFLEFTIVAFDGQNSEINTIEAIQKVVGTFDFKNFEPDVLEISCKWFNSLIDKRKKYHLVESSHGQNDTEDLDIPPPPMPSWKLTTVGVVCGRIHASVRKAASLILPYEIGRNRIWIDPAEYEYLAKRGLNENMLQALKGRVMPGKLPNDKLALVRFRSAEHTRLTGDGSNN